MNRTILVLMGTRPEVIKLAPVVMALRRHRGIRSIVCLSGQHAHMAAPMLHHFRLEPDIIFKIPRKTSSLTSLLSEASGALSKLFVRVRPDLIVVQGDTTTAMLGAMAGFYEGIPVAHVEAGLRSFDLHQPFPEEFNRRIITLAASLNFCPTRLSAANLLREGVRRGSIHVVGNTCIDALFWTLRRKPEPRVFQKGSRGILVTLHRRENWGDAIKGICGVLRRISEKYPDTQILLPVHKNPVVAKVIHAELGAYDRIRLVAPMDYRTFCRAMKEAYMIISDSGGVQEEALALGTPVLVTRKVTERPEVLRGGTVRLVGTSPRILWTHAARLLEDPKHYQKARTARFPFGKGDAGSKIADIIARSI